jgi:uncharacterized membrane protein
VPRLLLDLPRRFFLLTLLAGSALITAASLAYFDFETLPPFVVEKLPVVRFESLWLGALRVHVASAALALPLCIVLMTRTLQRRPSWHRRLGRLAGVVMLVLLVPSGVVLAFDAKGGRSVTLGFLVSGAIVAWSVVGGILAARRGDFVSHRRAMRHVLGQMSVAVSSRVLILGLDAVGVDPGVAYVAALWGPVVVSAAVAELVGRRSLPSLSKQTLSFERIRRHVSPPALLVRVRAVVRPVTRLGR